MFFPAGAKNRRAYLRLTPLPCGERQYTHKSSHFKRKIQGQPLLKSAKNRICIYFTRQTKIPPQAVVCSGVFGVIQLFNFQPAGLRLVRFLFRQGQL